MNNIVKIVKSKYQTKEWRNIQTWYKGGKKTECEKIQIQQIQQIMSITEKNQFDKTHMRINLETYKLEINKYPLKNEDGFIWTENFDGFMKINNIKNDRNNLIFYFNLKFVCDSGGSQTRSLRETFHFIKGQYKTMIKNKGGYINTYFINILDGDTCNKHMDKILYLDKKYNKRKNKNIFIGDMYNNYYV